MKWAEAAQYKKKKKKKNTKQFDILNRNFCLNILKIQMKMKEEEDKVKGLQQQQQQKLINCFPGSIFFGLYIKLINNCSFSSLFLTRRNLPSNK